MPDDDKDKQGFSWEDDDKKTDAGGGTATGTFTWDKEEPPTLTREQQMAQAKARVAQPTEFEKKHNVMSVAEYGQETGKPSTLQKVGVEGGLGLASGFSGMPESPTPLGDTYKELQASAQEKTEHPLRSLVSDVGLGPAKQFYQMGKGLYGAAGEVLGGATDTGENPEGKSRLERIAHGVGSGLGQVAQVAVPQTLEKITPPIRQLAAEKIVAPLARKPPVATMRDLKFGVNPGAAIANEGLVAGSREGLVDKINGRIKELSTQTDKQLQNHANAQNQIDVEPIIDQHIDAAIKAAKKVGAQSTITRLENLREGLKNEFGPTKGTPLEMNNLKRDIGDSAADLGAFKSTDPVEASAAAAMEDIYRGIKDAVNKEVPEAKPMNERVADLIGARTGVSRNIALHINKSPFSVLGPSHAIAKGLEATIGSTPVRTGLARIVNAGNINEIPSIAAGTPRPQAAPAQPTQPQPVQPNLRQAAIAPEAQPTPFSTLRPIGGRAAALAPIERGFAKTPPKGFEGLAKETGWEYGGKNAMGLHEFKQPGSNISISVKDADLKPETVRERIAAKLKEFKR